MKTLLSIPLFIAATHVSAACYSERPSEAPVLADGSVASKAEMLKSQEAVNDYVAKIRTFLDCNKSRLDDLEHNFYVNEAYSVAGAYNAELQEYRTRDVVAGR
ncbi:hypothetical protein EY643_00260 [Halioglobus maricola]|uniref:DUF4398 domain-containing protein n=1 Tax=Halioglobus maricola TaxID=2601894 RepID=A0A5P9NEQ7_9GAMM|nr:hypothetical protein [Halioglobus maricola]QFU74203.1 hypothetical protein EY643_00260 [Halioglobus maricola]